MTDRGNEPLYQRFPGGFYGHFQPSFAVLQSNPDPAVVIGGIQQPGQSFSILSRADRRGALSERRSRPASFSMPSPRSSHIAVKELSSTKPHVLRPAKEPARANGCEISKTGCHKATVGDLIELEYTYPAAPGAVPGAVERQADAQRRDRRLAAGDQDRRRRAGRTPNHRLLFRGEESRQRYASLWSLTAVRTRINSRLSEPQPAPGRPGAARLSL